MMQSFLCSIATRRLPKAPRLGASLATRVFLHSSAIVCDQPRRVEYRNGDSSRRDGENTRLDGKRSSSPSRRTAERVAPRQPSSGRNPGRSFEPPKSRSNAQEGGRRARNMPSSRNNRPSSAGQGGKQAFNTGRSSRRFEARTTAKTSSGRASPRGSSGRRPSPVLRSDTQRFDSRSRQRQKPQHGESHKDKTRPPMFASKNGSKDAAAFARDVRKTRSDYQARKKPGVSTRREEPRQDFRDSEQARELLDQAMVKRPSKHKGGNLKQQVPVLRRFPPKHLDVHVSCHAGLESFLSDELKALGLAHSLDGHGAKLTRIKAADLMCIHLHVGTASNVLLRCGDAFSARALGELKRKVEQLAWREILEPNVRLQVRVKSSKSRLIHTTAIGERVMEGVYNALGNSETKETATAATNAPVVLLKVDVAHDLVQISIDTSESPLHQRQYRLETGKAPLREDLAYGLLYSAGWRPPRVGGLSSSDGSAPRFMALLDPFCGSGTIAIEAAAMALGLPPGRLRPAPLGGTSFYAPDAWKQMIKKATQTSAKIDERIQVFASDRDEGVVKIVRSNARRAGVEDKIDVRACAFSSHPWLEYTSEAPRSLLLASNLPFGKRMKPPKGRRSSEAHPLLSLHQSLANRMSSLSKTYPEFAAILLTNEPWLPRMSGYQGGLYKVVLKVSHGGVPVSGMLTNSIMSH